MRLQQRNLYDNFISIIVNSADLHIEDKIKILENATITELYCGDNNLMYLEFKQAIKELREQTVNRHNKAS